MTLYFYNTGLCFSFITGAGGKSQRGYRAEARMTGLPEKAPGFKN